MKIKELLANQSPFNLRMAKGAFWSLSGSLISRGLSLISSIIIARYLGPIEYGELGAVQSTIGMLGMFTCLGLGSTVIKYIAQYRDSDKIKTGKIIALAEVIVLTVSAVTSIALYISSNWLTSGILSAPQLAPLLKIGTLYLFMQSVIGFQNGILAGLEAFKAIAIRSAISGICTFPLMVGGVYFFGIKGVVWALVISSILNVVLNYLAIKKITGTMEIKIRLKGSLSEKAILYKFALPIYLAGLLLEPVVWLCNTLLLNQPGGYSQMGLFNIANQWYMIILFAPVAFGAIVLPFLSSLSDKENSGKYLEVLKYNIILNMFASLSLSTLVIILSRLIISIYGTSYSAALPVLTILAITAIFVAYTNVITQAISSKGKTWLVLILNIIWAAVIISLAAYFINKGEGAIGLAKAYLMGNISNTVFSTIAIYWVLRQNKLTIADN